MATTGPAMETMEAKGHGRNGRHGRYGSYESHGRYGPLDAMDACGSWWPLDVVAERVQPARPSRQERHLVARHMQQNNCAPQHSTTAARARIF